MTDTPAKIRLGGHLITPETAAEKATKQIASAMDSVNLINELIQSGSRAQNDLDTIKRNAHHLRIVLSREFVANSSEDLTPLQAAIEASDSFLAEPHV